MSSMRSVGPMHVIWLLKQTLTHTWLNLDTPSAWISLVAFFNTLHNFLLFSCIEIDLYQLDSNNLEYKT
jgi:hypothetical protein